MLSSDPAALSITQLYGQHHGWLVGWLRKKVGCPHHADDLAHDTFVRIIGARDLLYLNEPRACLNDGLNISLQIVTILIMICVLNIVARRYVAATISLSLSAGEKN